MSEDEQRVERNRRLEARLDKIIAGNFKPDDDNDGYANSLDHCYASINEALRVNTHYNETDHGDYYAGETPCHPEHIRIKGARAKIKLAQHRIESQVEWLEKELLEESKFLTLRRDLQKDINALSAASEAKARELSNWIRGQDK